MISKNMLKELAAYRMQKRCDEDGVFVVEGVKMASEALKSGLPIRVICATSEWLASNADQIGSSTSCYEVSASELERLSAMHSPNHVWMLMHRKTVVAPHRSALTLALDRLQDPGNMGTIMRTADWYGIRHIVCSQDTVGCYNAKTVQATMGAVFRTQVEYVDLPQWLQHCHIPVYGASLHGKPLSKVPKPTHEAVLLIGNESRGISPEAMNAVTYPILIPNMGGTAESLNASVAAGILINHLLN